MTSQRGPDWDFYQCKCGNILFEYNVVTGEKFLTDTWKNCTISCMEPVSYVPPSARPFITFTRPATRLVSTVATQTGPNSTSATTQTPSSSCTCNHSSAFPATNHAELDNKSKSSPVLSASTVVEFNKASDCNQPESKTENLTLIETQSVSQNKVEEASKMQEKVQHGVDNKEINHGDKEDSSQETEENPEMKREKEHTEDSLVHTECKIKDNPSAGNSPSKSKDTTSDVREKARDVMPNKKSSGRVLRKRKSGPQEEKSAMQDEDRSPRKSARRSKK